MEKWEDLLSSYQLLDQRGSWYLDPRIVVEEVRSARDRLEVRLSNGVRDPRGKRVWTFSITSRRALPFATLLEGRVVLYLETEHTLPRGLRLQNYGATLRHPFVEALKKAGWSLGILQESELPLLVAHFRGGAYLPLRYQR